MGQEGSAGFQGSPECVDNGIGESHLDLRGYSTQVHEADQVVDSAVDICDAGVDALLLGCTHYPYLVRVIGEVMGPDVTLVSSADETALATRELLSRLDLLRPAAADAPAEHRFYSSGDISWFADLGGRLLGPELGAAAHWQPPE